MSPLPLPRRGRLALALIFAISLILAVGLALAVYLDYANFKRAHAQLVTSRMLVPAQDLRHLIETGMDVGLSLTQLTALPQRMREMVNSESDLLAIMIYDLSGQAVFHAAQADVAVSERMPQAGARHAGAEDAWSVLEPDRYLLNMRFENSFKQPAGTLVLAYDRAHIDEPVVAMRIALVKNVFLTLFGLTLLVTFGVYRLIRPLRTELYDALAWLRITPDLPAEERARRLGPRRSDKDSIVTAMAVTEASAQILRRVARVGEGQSGDADPPAAQPTATLTRLTGLNRFNRRILLFALLSILSGIVGVSYLSLLDFRREFEPSLHHKAETLGDSVVRLLTDLDAHGVPLERLPGLDIFFGSVRASNPDVSYLALVNSSGEILSAVGAIPDSVHAYFWIHASDQARATVPLELYFDTLTPIQGQSGPLGQIHVGQERSLIDRQVAEILWDLGTVALVTLLIALELLLFAVALVIHAPLSSIRQLAEDVRAGDFSARIVQRSHNELGQLAAALNARLDRLAQRCREALDSATSESARDRLAHLLDHYCCSASSGTRDVAEDRLSLIRWPFFLFIFAESLSLSFFPLYVEQLYTPVPGWSRELVLGLPISIFMLVWALSLPTGGAWSDRVGRRRSFLVGAFVAAVGLALTGTAQGIWDLILWRSLTALGYGIVFIAAQGYVVDYTPPAQRTRGMAMFLSAFFGGSLCGAAIGGILAERIGYASVFWLSALLALTAAAVAGRFLLAPAGMAVAARPRLRLADIGSLLRNPRFLAVTLLTAIPSKLILTGFLYYAMPLYLSRLELSAGDVGRVIMTYGLAMILFSPLVGYLADVWGRRAGFVAVGGLLAALAILLVEQQASALLAVLGIVLLGTAQAIGVSPQLTLVMDVSHTDIARIGAGTVMGIFRLLERIGNILGPIVVALLIDALGFEGAFVALGLYALLSVALFGMIWLAFTQRERRAACPPSDSALLGQAVRSGSVA